MTITIITSPFGALPPCAVGAVEKLFYMLAGQWAECGLKVCFVCAGGGENPRIQFRRHKKYNRTGSTKRDILWDFLYSLKAIWSCPPTDILLCNTFWSPVLAPLMRWKYRRLVYGVHRYPKGQFWLYPFVHKFICVSAAVANALVRQISSRRVSIVPNPIDTSVFAQEFRDVEKGCVMYAGRIHPLKGLRCLARACSRLYEDGICTKLRLLGPWLSQEGGAGEAFLSELRNLAGDCPLFFEGSISDAEKLADIERRAAIFVYPSEDCEGEAFGVAPLEAMALGVPTVVSSLRCFDEFVVDGENAVKFKVGDADDLERKMRKILTDISYAERIGNDAAKSAIRFSIPAIAEEYEKVFRGLES